MWTKVMATSLVLFSASLVGAQDVDTGPATIGVEQVHKGTVPLFENKVVKGRVTEVDLPCFGCTPLSVRFLLEVAVPVCASYIFRSEDRDEVRSAYAALLTAVSAGNDVEVSWPIPPDVGVAKVPIDVSTDAPKQECAVSGLKVRRVASQ